METAAEAEIKGFDPHQFPATSPPKKGKKQKKRQQKTKYHVFCPVKMRFFFKVFPCFSCNIFPRAFRTCSKTWRSNGSLRAMDAVGEPQIGCGNKPRLKLKELDGWIYLRSTPHPVTVTTRIVTFLVGNPYKPSFATVAGWGVDPRSTHTSSDGKWTL